MLSNQISIFGLNINIYSIMFTGGIFATFEFAKAQILKKYPHIKPFILDNITIVMVLSGLVGARLWYVASRIDYYSQNLIEILQPWKGGVAIQGGVIASILGAHIYLKKKNIGITFFQFIEEVMVFFLVGQAFGRWGNFYNQEVYGSIISKSLTTNLVFSLVILQAIIIFGSVIATKPIQSIKIKKQIEAKEWIKFMGSAFYAIILVRLTTGYGQEMVQHLFIDGRYRLPLFLIEGNLNLIAFIIIWKIQQKNPRFSKLGAYFITYGVIRSSLELLRNENDIMKIANIPVSFVLSIIFVIVGFIIFTKVRKTQ